MKNIASIKLLWVVLLLPVCLLASVEQEILVLFKPNILTILAIKDSADLSEITAPIEVVSCLSGIGVNKIKKVVPNFNPADTSRITEVGNTARLPDFSQLFLLTLGDEIDRDSAIIKLMNLASVISIEKNQPIEYKITDVNDPKFNEQWNLNDETGRVGINIRKAWDLSRGSNSIKLGIVDTGVDSLHPDLRGKVTLDGDRPYLDPISHEDNYHGTYVAGIAGAMTNNNLGIAGIDWFARIHSTKIEGSNVSAAVNAIYNSVYAGCKIINCSWGFYNWSQLLYSTFVWVYECNVLPVVAVEEYGRLGKYPESFGPWMCDVAGTTFDEVNIRDKPAPYYVKVPWVDVSAPGGDNRYLYGIKSTWFEGYYYGNGSYRSAYGTSAAAPHITGLAGLLLGANPGLKNYELEWIMKLSAKDIAPPNVDSITGYGIIDAYEAVRHVILPYEFLRGDVTFTEYDPVYRTFTNPIVPYDELAGYYKCKMIIADIWLNFDFVENPWAFLSLEGFSPTNPNDGIYWMRRDVSPTSAHLTSCFYYLYERIAPAPMQVNKWVPVDPSIIPMKYTIIGRKRIDTPTDLKATAIPNNNIKLQWQDNSHNEAKFIIERCICPGPFETYDSVNANIENYIDNNTTAGITYGYQIYAKAQEFTSGYSYAAYATAGLVAPNDLFFNPVVYDGVQLYWADNSENIEDGFKIEKQVGSQTYIYTVQPDQNYYYDNNIEPYYGQQVHYRVKAFKGNYESEPTNEIIFTPPGIITDSLRAVGPCYFLGYFNQRSLKLSIDGGLHLVLPHHGRIWYTKSTDNGATWQMGESLSWSEPSAPSLVINSYNRPCFVWDEIDAQGNHNLIYAYQDEAGNIQKSPPLFTTTHRLFPSIALTPSNLVYLAFVSDSTNSNGKVRRVEFLYNNPQPTNPVEYNTSSPWGVLITTDPQGNPYLVWEQRYMGTNIVYGSPSGGVEIVGSGSAPDIFAVSSNHVKVVWASGGEICYRERTESGWRNSIIVTQDPNVGNNVYFPRITHGGGSNIVLYKGTFTPNPGNIFGTNLIDPNHAVTLVANIANYYDAVAYPANFGTPKAGIIYSTNTSISGLYRLNFIIKAIPLVPQQIIYSQPPGSLPEFTFYNNARRFLKDTKGDLQLAYTNQDSIFHTFKNDSVWDEAVYLSQGKYPTLALSPNGILYCVWSFNGLKNFGDTMYYVEYLMMNSNNGSSWSDPTILYHTYGSFLWGVGASSMVIKDTMAYVIFKTYHGPTYNPPPGGQTLPVIILDGPALMYGKFSINHPAFSCQMLDAINWANPIPTDTSIYPDSMVPLLISPSIAVDQNNIPHVLWEGDSTAVRYYTVNPDTVIRELFDAHSAFPSLAMNGDRIDLFWTSRDSIRYRYGWTGTTNLSRTQTVAACASPFSSGPYLTWTKQDGNLAHLYYGVIPASGAIEPVELNYSTDKILFPQIVFNSAKTGTTTSLDFVWTEYSELDSLGYIYYLNLPVDNPPPTYSLDMGTEIPVPVLVHRDGYQALGDEDYQTFDYDTTELTYRLTLHSPHEKYKIRWTYYHQEPNKVKLQFNIDDILHRNRWVNPGEQTTEEAWIPQSCLEDNEITIKVKKLSGTIAVLSGIEIYVEEVGSGGGPQGDETRISRPFFLENMYPNPARGILRIRFNSPDERKVTVKLYDVAGRLAEKIFDGKAMIGMNRIPLVVNTLATGVYFIQIDAGNYNKVEKLILLR